MTHVVMTDSWPGYWGAGETEDEALANCKRSGGRPSKTGTVRIVIHEAYDEVGVDMMGGLSAVYTGDPDTPYAERPKMVCEAWRVGPRGKRQRLDL
jgi:hypothetical protein